MTTSVPEGLSARDTAEVTANPILDRALLRELAAFEDEDCVLSVYVTADPTEEPTQRPAWRIRIAGQLAELRTRVDTQYDKHTARRMLAAFDRLGPELDDVLSSRERGLGRAYFAALGSGRTHIVQLQVPVGDLVVFEPTAYLRRLLESTALCGPAGVLLVSRSGVRLVDLRYGLATDVGSLELDVDTERWREKVGPTARQGQSVVNHRDEFNRRLEDNIARFLRAAAPPVERRAAELEWSALVVTGDPKLTESFASGLGPNDRRAIVMLEANLENLSAPEIAEAVEPRLDTARRRHVESLALQVKDSALANGRGILGLEPTRRALREGSVSHLLLESGREWAGQPYLGERMIEAALRTDAEVTMLHAEAAAPLAEFEGVAAALRW